MNFVQNIVDQFQQRIFDSVIRNKMVYNSCWEDPRIDRKLLALHSESKVLMLTSAGCNALDYLLDDPKLIHCVDINPAQNALLALKKALFRINRYQTLWSMFGLGQSYEAYAIYHQNLRPVLSPPAQKFWDHHIDYFLPSSSAPSFYFRGTSGSVAHLIHKRIKHKGLYGDVRNLLEAETLEEQHYYFEAIEPYLWNSFSRWIFKRNATMAMLGVPRGQRAMIDDDTQGGLPFFIQRALREVFTRRPISDNYFWRVYLTGSYTLDCCPHYLKATHYHKIQQRIDRLHQTTGSLLYFLKHNTNTYSHFVLLDHQDWMAYHQPEKLAETWRLILSHAEPGARILFRSAGKDRSFLPDFLDSHVQFDNQKPRYLHTKDRVGTYASTHLATVTAAYV